MTKKSRLLRWLATFVPIPRPSNTEQILRCVYRPLAIECVGARFRDSREHPDVTVLLELMVAAHLAVDPNGDTRPHSNGTLAARDIAAQWQTAKVAA